MDTNIRKFSFTVIDPLEISPICPPIWRLSWRAIRMHQLLERCLLGESESTETSDRRGRLRWQLVARTFFWCFLIVGGNMKWFGVTMSSHLENVLRKTFGYSEFRCEEQRRAAQEIFEGENDVFVSMPTGAGKHHPEFRWFSFLYYWRINSVAAWMRPQ